MFFGWPSQMKIDMFLKVKIVYLSPTDEIWKYFGPANSSIFQKSVKIGNGNANLVNAYQKLSVVTEFQTAQMQLMNWIVPRYLLFLTATIWHNFLVGMSIDFTIILWGWTKIFIPKLHHQVAICGLGKELPWRAYLERDAEHIFLI